MHNILESLMIDINRLNNYISAIEAENEELRSKLSKYEIIVKTDISNLVPN